jgi:nucleoside triphosphatase
MMTALTFERGIELIVGVVVENHHGYILVTQSPKWRDRWVVPGSHVDAGELIGNAAIREVREETGLRTELVSVFSWGEFFPKDFHRLAHFVSFRVHCRILGSDKIILDETEVSSYQWVTPTEALGMDLADGMREIIEEFIQYRNRS